MTLSQTPIFYIYIYIYIYICVYIFILFITTKTKENTYKRHIQFIHNLSKIKIDNKSNGSSVSVG